MHNSPIPPALKSRQHLARTQTIPEFPLAPALPLVPRGVTYTMAQEATWIDDEHFAIGRWDGSLGIYAFTESTSQGPLINCAVNAPAQEGVQMITPLRADSFATSNDDSSIAIWKRKELEWSDIVLATLLRYDPIFGAANSAVAVGQPGDPNYLVAGHAGGFVTIWEQLEEHWRLVNSVDIRASHPVNPWGIHNIRGIDVVDASATKPCVITGSEDGDLVLLGVPSGEVLSRACYNKSAQRGINSLAIHDGALLVANCSVGSQDRNLWAYRIDKTSSRILPLDSANLAVASQAPQVFNFDVVWGKLSPGAPAFFCSTEEGVLWMGRLGSDGKITLMGHVPVTRATGPQQVLQLGSAVCYSLGRIVVANYDIAEFALLSDPHRPTLLHQGQTAEPRT